MDLEITKEFVALYFDIDESFVKVEELEPLGLTALIEDAIELTDSLLEGGKLPFSCGFQALTLKVENLKTLKDLSNVFANELIGEGINPCDFNIYGVESLAIKGDFKDFKVSQEDSVGSLIIVNSNLSGNCYIKCEELEIYLSYIESLEIDAFKSYVHTVDVNSLYSKCDLIIFEQCILSNLKFEKLADLIIDSCKFLKLEIPGDLKVLKVLNCPELTKIDFPKNIISLQLENLPSLKSLAGMSKHVHIKIDENLKKLYNGGN